MDRTGVRLIGVTMAALSQEKHHSKLLQAASSHPDGVQPLRELLTVLRRRRRVIFWTVALLTGTVALAASQLEKSYTSTALVMVEAHDSGLGALAEAAQTLPADESFMETEITSIQTWEYLDRAVEMLRLDASLGRSRTDPRDELLGSIVRWLPDGWVIAAGLADEPVSLPQPAPEAERSRAIDALGRGLDVAQVGQSRILSISFSWPDPREAARIANGVARAYIQGQLDDKLARFRRDRAWLTERVEELRLQVLAAERAVQTYLAANGLVGAKGTDLDGQRLGALTAALISVRAERTAKEINLQRLRELQGEADADELLAEALASPRIMSLRQQQLELLREEAELSQEFAERHPRILQLQSEKQRVAARIGHAVQNAIRNLDNEVAVARSRESALTEELSEAKGHTALIEQTEVQLRQLEREAAANRSLYETFLMRLKETEQRQATVKPDVRIISPAQVPDIPDSVSQLQFTAGSFTLALVAAMTLAFLLEQLDSRIRSGRQVEEVLEIPVLGLVPKVAKRRREGRPLHAYVADKPRSVCAEAIRRLYAQIQLASVGRPAQLVLVTSALPGEGKTSLAASLAVYAAQCKKKTLLIDLDLRRPSVGGEFDLREKSRGILAILAGQASLREAVHADEASGVDVLAVGESHNDRTALLTSRLGAILAEARVQYDFVVIDTPPVLPAAEAKVLSPLVDAVMFVVAWDRTKRDAAQAAIKELRTTAATIAGAVLNQVDLRKHAKYHYGDAYQYYRNYQHYYSN